jgi:hypothetical protein
VRGSDEEQVIRLKQGEMESAKQGRPKSCNSSVGTADTMPHKIFISYRRQDSGANVLGIGQYLEHEFGRKNVFIDVDMRAGTKFPQVLEERLAECKVMLVLIGPNWLDAIDEHGRRRLDDPDDWVRLEVGHALRRGITVIPVCVNGADLPSRGLLPDEMRGLLDHQAASVSLAGFRNETSGLVRDIRSISAPFRWKRFAIGASTGLVIFLALLLVVLGNLFPKAIDYFRTSAPSTSPTPAAQDDILFGTKAGDLVLYGWVMPGAVSLAHYFKSNSVNVIGDRVEELPRSMLN